jgi:hypothetical protein
MHACVYGGAGRDASNAGAPTLRHSTQVNAGRLARSRRPRTVATKANVPGGRGCCCGPCTCTWSGGRRPAPADASPPPPSTSSCLSSSSLDDAEAAAPTSTAPAAPAPAGTSGRVRPGLRSIVLVVVTATAGAATATAGAWGALWRGRARWAARAARYSRHSLDLRSNTAYCPCAVRPQWARTCARVCVCVWPSGLGRQGSLPAGHSCGVGGRAGPAAALGRS